MIRGSCWLSFAAHPIRIYPRVPYWLFFKTYASPPCNLQGAQSIQLRSNLSLDRLPVGRFTRRSFLLAQKRSR